MKNLKIKEMNYKAEAYEQEYKPYMQIFEGSIVGDIVGRSPSHNFSLGTMLERWEEYKSMKEADGTIATLGEVPNVALGVITANFSSNAMNAFMNVQPLPEQSGNIYFEETKSTTARGSVTAGQVLLSPNVAPEVYPVNYAGEVATAALGNTSSGTTAYSYTAGLAATPVRPRTVTVAVALSGGTLTAVDVPNADGLTGTLKGDFSGTVTYASGNITVALTADPLETAAVSAGYGTDFEGGKSEIEIEVDLKTYNVNSRIFALKAQLGIFKQFALQNRFGINGKERLATRLTQELNNELVNEAIAKIAAANADNATYTETWNKTPDANVSWMEHKLEFLDVIARAENKLIVNAGRGKISAILASPETSTIIRNLPGFVASGTVGQGATIYGTLDDIVIVRCPQLSGAIAYCVYRGEEPFDGAGVYAPYMPIVSIEDVPVENTVLLRRNGVAHMAAVAVPSTNFVVKINITGSTYNNSPSS